MVCATNLYCGVLYCVTLGGALHARLVTTYSIENATRIQSDKEEFYLIRSYCDIAAYIYIYIYIDTSRMILQLCLVTIVRSERPSGSRCCRGRAQGSMDCNSNSDSNTNNNSNIKVDYNVI